MKIRGANMSNYEKSKLEETLYLNNTIDFIKNELQKDEDAIKDRRSNLITSRREMWEQAPKSAHDFDRIPEMNHYLAEITYQTQNYERIAERIKKYYKMLDTPYFGRFDFKEDGYEDVEKIYIGLYNLMNMDDLSIWVYDWRSPIASMYYQCEVGRGSYTSPGGILSGEILMKRQYKIEQGNLTYFFDSSIQIQDDILQEVLSHNTSPKMRHIVETIQREQDLIIRDTQSQLLMVQGVAGSGKTSIALHRIAFLLYTGMDSKLFSNNIMIVSPNAIFSKYISSVLPDLGEENVEQTTFDDISYDILGCSLTIEKRGQMLESLVLLHKHRDLTSKIKRIEFKGSLIFKQIIDRLIQYYERKLIPFEDVYYNGKIVKTKEQLTNQLLSDRTSLPIAKKLNRIENILISHIEELKNERLEKIRQVVERTGKHAFNVEEYSNILAYKEIRQRKKQIRKFTKIDYMGIYKLLFQKNNLLVHLAKDLGLPDHIDAIISETKKELGHGYISYEDSAALLYLKLKLEGHSSFNAIRHLVIDEAQDYYPLQYEIFKLLFGHASFTVLGDFNQTLEKHGKESLYNEISNILGKEKAIKLSLNKGYRSSYEINVFSQKIIGHQNQDFISFSRHGSEPKVVKGEDLNSLHAIMAEDIEDYYAQGYESIAVICKTEREAGKLQKNLQKYTTKKIQTIKEHEIKKGTLVLPGYMAKGLEFDAVLIYNVSKSNYSSDLDKKLIYIGCTRALHQLSLYYVGAKSIYL